MSKQQYKLPVAKKENKRQYIILTAANLLPAPHPPPNSGSPDSWNLEILHLWKEIDKKKYQMVVRGKWLLRNNKG